MATSQQTPSVKSYSWSFQTLLSLCKSHLPQNGAVGQGEAYLHSKEGTCTHVWEKLLCPWASFPCTGSKSGLPSRHKTCEKNGFGSQRENHPLKGLDHWAQRKWVGTSPHREGVVSFREEESPGPQRAACQRPYWGRLFVQASLSRPGSSECLAWAWCEDFLLESQWMESVKNVQHWGLGGANCWDADFSLRLRWVKPLSITLPGTVRMSDWPPPGAWFLASNLSLNWGCDPLSSFPRALSLE